MHKNCGIVKPWWLGHLQFTHIICWDMLFVVNTLIWYAASSSSRHSLASTGFLVFPVAIGSIVMGSALFHFFFLGYRAFTFSLAFGIVILTTLWQSYSVITQIFLLDYYAYEILLTLPFRVNGFAGSDISCRCLRIFGDCGKNCICRDDVGGHLESLPSDSENLVWDQVLSPVDPTVCLFTYLANPSYGSVCYHVLIQPDVLSQTIS